MIGQEIPTSTRYFLRSLGGVIGGTFPSDFILVWLHCNGEFGTGMWHRIAIGIWQVKWNRMKGKCLCMETGQKPPPAKTPLLQKKQQLSGQNSPPAKISLWPKPPSDKKPPPAKKKKNILPTPLLSLINKYHPKLRLFYIKFRFG